MEPGGCCRTDSEAAPASRRNAAAVPDLAIEQRWPAYIKAAKAQGVDTAFRILTKAWSTRNVKLRDVAASVIASISGEKEIHTYFDEQGAARQKSRPGRT